MVYVQRAPFKLLGLVFISRTLFGFCDIPWSNIGIQAYSSFCTVSRDFKFVFWRKTMSNFCLCRDLSLCHIPVEIPFPLIEMSISCNCSFNISGVRYCWGVAVIGTSSGVCVVERAVWGSMLMACRTVVVSGAIWAIRFRISARAGRAARSLRDLYDSNHIPYTSIASHVSVTP